ncbi:hypothetical protein BDK51DRAFT_52354 [Blyttiomyces helicus]|uniref:Uncharacterized protein n=1 Tax=Blyttiomyces helicus TaxID=388810 RepID=A0A4V1IQJ7_9FUNG|nr:hypothetical protein BDK51DRAFT_52354 [Blyttiomyces helicus]|eukprot:RKO86797.1 hypothetical protein BDK51DRAFT_52354 [Blyttiomyces helicus]
MKQGFGERFRGLNGHARRLPMAIKDGPVPPPNEKHEHPQAHHLAGLAGSKEHLFIRGASSATYSRNDASSLGCGSDIRPLASSTSFVIPPSLHSTPRTSSQLTGLKLTPEIADTCHLQYIVASSSFVMARVLSTVRRPRRRRFISSGGGTLKWRSFVGTGTGESKCRRTGEDRTRSPSGGQTRVRSFLPILTFSGICWQGSATERGSDWLAEVEPPEGSRWMKNGGRLIEASFSKVE